MTKRQPTKHELTTREQMFFRAHDAMDAFASEQTEPRPRGESPAEPLDDFAAEVTAHTIRSSVPLASQRPAHRIAFTCLGVATGVCAFFLVEQSAHRVPPQISPSEPSQPISEGNTPAPVPALLVADDLPPVVDVRATPIASPLLPEVETAPPRSVLPVTPRTDPPRATNQTPPDGSQQSSTAYVAPRRSQALPPLVGVPASPPSRPGADVLVADVPAPVASAAEPIAEPVLVPPPAPPTVAAVPPVASPSAPPAPSALAAPSAIESNTSEIQNTLARYRKAFSALDAGAAREVWPTVNERTLNRAFDGLEKQEVLFERCKIDVTGVRAEANCNGIARYVTRVGSRTPHIDRRQWRFSLVKVRDEWLIGAVDTR